MAGPDRPPTGAVAVADRHDARDADFAAYLAARQASLLRTAYLLTGNRHADRLLLEVREDNHVACAFYAARGFTEIDRRPRYYADGTTAVILFKEIA